MLVGIEKRIITSLLLGLIVVGTIITGSSQLFTLLMLTFVAIAAWEWLGLSQLHPKNPVITYLACLSALICVYYILDALKQPLLIAIAAVLIWSLAFAVILAYQHGKAFSITKTFKLVIGLVMLAIAWNSLTMLYKANNGSELVLLLFILIWTVDSSAYFIGTYFGKHRLASRVSPAKSWEGFLGSMLVSVLLAGTYSVYASIDKISYQITLIVIFLVTAAFSVIGDLFISVMKRDAHMKDTGSILPGHGGILDRLDSLIAAAPVYAGSFFLIGDRY